MPTYYIRVQGHLPDRYMAWFDDLNITRQTSGETLLAGELVDQGALFGVLLKIRDLGIPLLAVVSDSGQTAPGIDGVTAPDLSMDAADKRREPPNYLLQRLCEALLPGRRRYRRGAAPPIRRLISCLDAFLWPDRALATRRYAFAVA